MQTPLCLCIAPRKGQWHQNSVGLHQSMPTATKPGQPPQQIQQTRWFARLFGAIIFSVARCYLFKTALSYLKTEISAHFNFSYNEIHNGKLFRGTWLWQKPHECSICMQTLVCKHLEAKIAGMHAALLSQNNGMFFFANVSDHPWQASASENVTKPKRA